LSVSDATLFNTAAILSVSDATLFNTAAILSVSVTVSPYLYQ
jgi:hypothetical protein